MGFFTLVLSKRKFWSWNFNYFEDFETAINSGHVMYLDTKIYCDVEIFYEVMEILDVEKNKIFVAHHTAILITNKKIYMLEENKKLRCYDISTIPKTHLISELAYKYIDDPELYERMENAFASHQN